jgi:hypothetical protein
VRQSQCRSSSLGGLPDRFQTHCAPEAASLFCPGVKIRVGTWLLRSSGSETALQPVLMPRSGSAVASQGRLTRAVWKVVG